MVGATKEPTNRNKLDLFGEYVATNMIKLSQKLDEDVIESLEYDITTVLMKARHKTGLIQTWLNYYQLENFPAQRSTTPYVMRCTIWHNLTQLAQFRKRKKHP